MAFYTVFIIILIVNPLWGPPDMTSGLREVMKYPELAINCAPENTTSIPGFGQSNQRFADRRVTALFVVESGRHVGGFVGEPE